MTGSFTGPAAAARALFAVTRRPGPVLAERRAPGATLPTVPLAGGELSYPEVAGVLFEAYADELPAPRVRALLAALSGAVARLERSDITRAISVLTSIDLAEFPELADCWALAHRLCVAFWYEHASARPMTAGEVGVCLYLAGVATHRRLAHIRAGRPVLLPAGAIGQGAALLPARVVVALGAELASEFTPTPALGGSRPGTGPGWLYRQLLPDTARRAACFRLARASGDHPAPLLARPRSGGLLLGATPPTAPPTGRPRPVREGW